MTRWACNTLRYLLKQPPVRDGATVIIGGGNSQLKGVPPGNAEVSLKKPLAVLE